MSQPLRALQIEDSESDAALVVRLLEKSGYDVSFKRVEDAQAMRAALAGGEWDVIVADYHLPQFDARAALKVLHETGRDIPFIVVSGTIGEDVAVEMMRMGACDYLMKGNLARLAPTVQREIKEAQTRLERTRAELALQDSERRFRRLVESDVIGIVTADPHSILEANDHFLAILGYTREEFQAGMIRWKAITPPKYASLDERAVRQLLDAGSCPTVEQEYFRKDGKLVPVLVGRVALQTTRDPRFLCFIVDLTERKRLEEQFRQAQKLESIGRLAGGVAHDFNNLLTVITGYAHMALGDLSVQHPLYDAIAEIAKAATRAADLTRQLLTFSRCDPVEAKTINLNDTVRNFEKMLRRLIGEDIQLLLSLDPQAGVLRADPGQIEQVIMNLAVNARDAMPTGGRLMIETSGVFVDEQFPRVHPSLIPGPYVTLTVNDTGVGMPPEVQAHLFEPFFTTKEQGKGTGLGLSTVYGIVKQNSGSIWVYSEIGQGSTFKLFFPAVEDVREEAPPVPIAAASAGDETILVAEDEVGVRSFVRRILERNGYSVLEASSGQQAIELAREHSGPINLLLTDVIMPEMGGAELADQFVSIRPGVPVLCMSGYTDRLWRRPQVAASYIQKPFTSGTLLTQIRELLDPA